MVIGVKFIYLSNGGCCVLYSNCPFNGEGQYLISHYWGVKEEMNLKLILSVFCVLSKIINTSKKII